MLKAAFCGVSEKDKIITFCPYEWKIFGTVSGVKAEAKKGKRPWTGCSAILGTLRPTSPPPRKKLA
jgi:hypothetical protein